MGLRLYGAFATVIAAAFFPEADPANGLLAAFAVFGVAFLARPAAAWPGGPRAESPAATDQPVRQQDREKEHTMGCCSTPPAAA